MTDIILALILGFVVLIWSQRSTWLEGQKRRAKKRGAKLRKRIKNLRKRWQNRRMA